MSAIDMQAPLVADSGTSLPRLVRIGANAVIFGLWIWLYRAVFDYLAIIFSREDFRTNQLVLLGIIALIATRVRKDHMHLRLDVAPRLSYPALILVLGSSLLYLAVERFLDINTLSASLFGLTGYGLIGLWIPPQRWRRGLPAALLLIGSLPFGEHMQTFVGYPMRILTAALVRDGLTAVGIPSIGIDTILVLENGVSQIDLPCSGVRSLWTGTLFLLAATWIDDRRFNLRWLLTGLILAALLFTANLVRVGVLVMVGGVAGWTLLAEMLHVPLGVLGFAAACGAAVALLRLLPSGDDARSEPRRPALACPTWLAPFLALVFLVMGLAYVSRPWTGLAQPTPEWEFPADLVTEPMPLTPDEIDWLTRGGAESADRRRFEWRGVTGSIMFITSNTWRAQHRPERCFEVYGLSLEDSRAYLVGPEFPLRFLSLSYGQGQGRLSATYWFQSPNRTTDDYGSRIWADLALERQRWVLVTILFDDDQDPLTPDMREFYTAVHNAVAGTLEGGSSWAKNN